MGLEPLDLSEVEEIDISAYGQRVVDYVSGIETGLRKPIKFFNTATHPDRSERAKWTRLDFPRSVFSDYAVVWVDMHILQDTPFPETHLAHEATHAQLILVDSYRFPFGSKFKIVGHMYSLLQDLVVEERLAHFSFDEEGDFEYSTGRMLDLEEKRVHYPPDNVEPQHYDLFYAIKYAIHFLSRHCRSRHNRRLRRACRNYHDDTWAKVKKVIKIVKNTPRRLEPVGQEAALRQITGAFHLDKTYVLKSIGDLTRFDHAC